jgi:hypothetical protein
MRRFMIPALIVGLLLSIGALTNRSTSAQVATPVSPDAEITTEAVTTVQLPADAIPPLPAVFDVWQWRLIPGQELRFEAEELPPSIAADVVLAGENSVRSEGRLQVRRAAGLEEVAPGTEVTVGTGDVVIYVENQAAQLVRNSGDEDVRAISFGVFSAAPPAGLSVGPVSQEDWERSGLAGQNLTVSVERLTVPPGASVPAYVPDVRSPRIFIVAEGVAHWAILAPDRATPPSPISYYQDQVIWFRTLHEGDQLQLRNDADQPLVLLQVTVSAGHMATPVAGTPTT